MGVEEELARLSPDKDTALTIGVFDGVHLGHKFLISRLKERAREEDLLTGVITFRQHPQEVISPENRLPALTDLEERCRLLKDEGVDTVIVLPFSREVAKLTPREFIGLLKRFLRLRALVVGPDFALGHKREGDAETLSALGRQMGFTVTVVPPVSINGDTVSSTAIRSALARGDMEKVRRLLGRHFSLRGRVVTGERRGAKLGFPTANIDVAPEQALPADGIYVTRVYIDSQSYKSVTNIGSRPTFDGGNRTIEVYIIDFKGDLYGRELKIDIIERLREEKRFSSVEELKRQMEQDVKDAIAAFESAVRVR